MDCPFSALTEVTAIDSANEAGPNNMAPYYYGELCFSQSHHFLCIPDTFTKKIFLFFDVINQENTQLCLIFI